MKPRCHTVAVLVWDLAHAHNIRLSCVWIPHTSTERRNLNGRNLNVNINILPGGTTTFLFLEQNVENLQKLKLRLAGKIIPR